MKSLTRTLPLLLAAALQLLPLLRNIVTLPAANSSFAIILRWGIGSTAAFGAYDAFSAASNPYYVPMQTNITLTVGTYYTNSIIVTNTGTDPGAYFNLTTSAGLDSGQIGGNQTTTVCLPAGLTLKCYDTATKHFVYAAIYGTPTIVSATTRVNVDAGFSGAGDIYTNIYFTVTAGGSPPVITNHPASVTNVAGGSATLSVGAGTPPLFYQWKFNTNTVLPGATNATLTLTNLRASQAGAYSVTITNSSGATNSLAAMVIVTNPLPPVLSAPTNRGGQFQFTFVPVVGLTNSVQINSGLTGGSWVVRTNVPPPANASPVIVSDPWSNSNRFYRVVIQP